MWFACLEQSILARVQVETKKSNEGAANIANKSANRYLATIFVELSLRNILEKYLNATDELIHEIHSLAHLYILEKRIFE